MLSFRFLLPCIASCLVAAAPFHRPVLWRRYRGGGGEELTLDQKVQAAMKKLGIQPVASKEDSTGGTSTTAILENPLATNEDVETAETKVEAMDTEEEKPPTPFTEEGASCTTDGVCTPPSPPEDPTIMAHRIADTMGVDPSLAWAALGATSESAPDSDQRVFNEQSARSMIQQELDMIGQIPEDAEEVKQLLSEGYEDTFLVRRALAFAERNVDDARAILQAEIDEEGEEETEEAPEQPASGFKTVEVDAGFDPTALGGATKAEPTAPAPAPRDAVIFEATTADVFNMVLKSPVPVLVDVYADWCGPCKALGPILEEMAIKAGGAFRLVKVNSDNEQAVASALEVTSLPSVFGVRDGKIIHMFKGMPRSEEMMKNFMMGLLIPGQTFNPPVTADEKKNYDELTHKLIKTAAAASYPFGARERLQERTSAKLNELVDQSGDVFDAEASAVTIRSLLSNVIKDPFEAKFRSINLSNKVIQSKIAKYPAALAILKSVGFVAESKTSLALSKASRIVNTAPLVVARDAIDKWVDKTRYEVARSARKRKDEADRVQVKADLAAAKAEEEKRLQAEAAEKEEEEIDPNLCVLKLRLDGKRKVHEVKLDGDEALGTVLTKIPGFADDAESQIMCVAKRLVVKSTDTEALAMSLRDHNLFPAASLVIKPLSATTATSSSNKTKRKSSKKKLKRGSHTMQSIGIYSKDDNAKGELIDGGGGVLYEQDVTDDEEEKPDEADKDDLSAGDESNEGSDN